VQPQEQPKKKRGYWSKVFGIGHGPILLRDRIGAKAAMTFGVRQPQMRLRFEAIPFRREMIINTITANRTPETTRIIVGSIEAPSFTCTGTRVGAVVSAELP